MPANGYSEGMTKSSTTSTKSTKSKPSAAKTTAKKATVKPTTVVPPVVPAPQPESRFVKGLLLVVAIAIAGFAAWYIYDTKQQTDELYSAGDRSSSLLPSDISVESSKLPAGWMVQKQADGVLSVVNDETKCSVNASYSKNVNQQVSDTTTSDTAQKVGTSDVSLSTSSGTKVVTADTVKIDNGGNTTYQQNAVDATGQAVTSAQLTCNNASDLSNAQAALQAITFNAEF